MLTKFLTQNKAHNITIGAAVIVMIISFGILQKTEDTKNAEVSLIQQAKEQKTSSEQPAPEQKITIDIAGAVDKPGVYTFKIGSRLVDALSRANGLSANADTNYFYQQFNQASVLVDQQKIYIPSTKDTAAWLFTSTTANNASADSLAPDLISINGASQLELDGLPGLGPVTVEKLIGNRPYTTIQDLVDSKILSQSIFDKIKDQITL